MIKYRYSINGQVIKENSLSYNGYNNPDRSIEVLASSLKKFQELAFFDGSDICFICQELNEKQNDFYKKGRCTKHKNYNFCGLCRKITIGLICLSCSSSDLK